MKYRSEIDGLRAIAVLAVIIFHANALFLPGGFLGVDIFFVISGFLITSIIREEMDSGAFSFRDFYARRARRILPALYLTVLTSLPLGLYFLIPDDLHDLALGAVWTTLFAPNFYFWDTADYFSRSAEFKPLVHTWSLGVEEQFYLLFPAFMLVLAASARRLAITALIAASFTFALAYQQHDMDAVFYLLPFRAWELAAGALAAVLEAKALARVQTVKAREALGFAALALILSAITAPAGMMPGPLQQAAAVTGAVAGLMFWRKGTLCARILGSAPLVAIGLVSYSAYLWHQPVLAFARSIDGLPLAPGFTLLLGALTFGLAFLSWRYVETPFRRQVTVSARAFISASLAMFIAINALALGILYMTRQPDALLSPLQKQVFQTAQESPARKKCHLRQGAYSPPAEACVFNNQPARLAVLGNSHGVELAYALGQELAASGTGVAQFTYSACPPLYGRADPDRPECARWTNDVVNYLADDADMEAVVIAYSMTSLASGIMEDAQDEPAKRPAAIKSLLDTADRLVAAGKRVVIVLQAPRLPRHIQYYIKDVHQNGDASFMASFSKSLWTEKLAALQQQLAAHFAGSAGRVIVIDPAGKFCPADSCAAIINGKALFFDEHHPSLEGATIIAREILGHLNMN